jgi:copper transport protein
VPLSGAAPRSGGREHGTILHHHRARRAWAVAVATLALAAVHAPGAQAHAVLVDTRPGNDVVVPASPQRVVLTFSEPVDASLGSVRVLDGEGEQVDDGNVARPDAREVAVGLDPGLAPGTYTVAWRVVSADSHPVAGAFVFHVLRRGVATSLSFEELTGTSQAVDIAFTATRFFDLGLLLLVVGGSVALVVALPSAAWPVRRRLYGLLASFAGLLAAVALLNILFQGATAGGLTLPDAFSWRLFRAVVRTDYGEVMAIQAALAAALALTALALGQAGKRERELLQAFTLVLVAALSLTPSLSGHARTLGGLGLVSDILHVLSAAIWVGGLAFLVLGLVAAEADRWPLATRAVPRFSTTAVGSVAVLLVAGIVSAYLELRTWSALWETTYGLLVLAKIVLVAPLVALGAYNNRYAVPRLKAGIASVLERRRFLYTVGLELSIMVAIVAVTAVLVETQPARVEQLAASRPVAAPVTPTTTPEAGGFEGQVLLGEIPARVEVDPALAGENTITLTLDQEEGAPPPTEVRVSASLPSEDIQLIRFQAKPDPAVSGRYVVDDASLSIAGEWSLQIALVLNEFDLVSDTIDVPIGGS